MGTRNLIEVKLDGEIKVAQYGQWDGYLTGQGEGIANFIHGEMNLEKFKSAIANCKFHDDNSIEELQRKIDAEGIKDWAFKYPWLSRDSGSKILLMVQENNGLQLLDDREFKNNTLFCEFHYLIDLDDKTVTCGNICLPFEQWTSEKMKSLEEQEE